MGKERSVSRGLLRQRVLSVLSPLAALGAWEAMAAAGLLDTRFVPPPTAVMRALWALLLSGELTRHLLASLSRILFGFLSGAIPGIGLGLWMGLSPTARAVIDPFVAATFPIPKIAILPLLMIFFGLGETSKILIIAIATVYLVLINTMTGVMNLPRIYLDVARNFSAPRWKLFTRVVLPGALPFTFSGLRLGLSTSLIVIVAAEFVAANEGIGFLIWQSWQTLAVERMFVGLMVLAMLGVVITVALQEAERILIPWRENR
jgi:NitT/TauT family transport system permease protein